MKISPAIFFSQNGICQKTQQKANSSSTRFVLTLRNYTDMHNLPINILRSEILGGNGAYGCVVSFPVQ